MTDQKTTLTILPNHLDDLRGSGLSDATISAAGIRSISQEEAKRIIGFDPRCGGWAIDFPLWDSPNLWPLTIVKPDISYEFPDGRKAKYLMPKGAKHRLYIPPKPLLNDHQVLTTRFPLYVTEGIKKCLKAAQEGLACVGLSGVDAFTYRDDYGGVHIVPELDFLCLKDREVKIVFDSDIVQKYSVRQAQFKLGCESRKRKVASVVGIRLPPGPDDKKVGFDDYMMGHTERELNALPVDKLSDPPRITIDGWLGDVSENGDQPDVRSIVPELAQIDPLLYAQKFRKRVAEKADIPLGVLDGVVETARQQSKNGSEKPEVLGPTLEPRPIAEALREAESLFKKFIVLPASGLESLLSFWCLGSFLFENFSYFGYLAFRSPTPRCGKSRALKLVSMLSNGNPPVTANPTAAQLFRSGRPVLILDEVDRLKNSDKETFGDVLAVLNLGFEKGGVVERVEKGKDGFVVKSFPVYGPKVLAGIEALADALSDRAFQIRMERCKSRLPRMNPRRLAEIARQIRTDFEDFAQTHGDDIEKAYSGLPDEVPYLKEYDDRMQDVSEGLITIAAIVDSNLGDMEQTFLPDLLDGLKTVNGRREKSTREEEFIAFLDVIKDKVGPEREGFIATSILLEDFKTSERLQRIETGRGLAGFLRNFDLFPSSNGPKTNRGYWIRKEWLEAWEGRYR